ncbi:unnamed protein product, partial [Ascophyllum nodosum]
KADESHTPEEEKYMLKFPYREAVGALIYMAKMARPDIAFVARAVVRFWKNPGVVHYKNAMM